MKPGDFRLVNEFQRGFPLVPRPFDVLARNLGSSEGEVLSALARLQGSGTVSRVGAVFRPGAIGASTLAAMSVPESRLPEVAERVSAYAEVNHNYEREHHFNLWFVATTADQVRLARVLGDIERACGAPVLSLPLEEEYHIDLGFDLGAARAARSGEVRTPRQTAAIGPRELLLVSALQQGLELAPRPFAALASRCGLSERAVIACLRRWIETGVIRRLGIVVRHLELGFGANAMAVWNVPDEPAGRFGTRLAREDAVTLCYRRRRHLPQWPYNLYCMIHGKDRAEVRRELRAIAARAGLAHYPGAVLFSRRRFKQTGARYFPGPEPVHASA